MTTTSDETDLVILEGGELRLDVEAAHRKDSQDNEVHDVLAEGRAAAMGSHQQSSSRPMLARKSSARQLSARTADVAKGVRRASVSIRCLYHQVLGPLHGPLPSPHAHTECRSVRRSQRNFVVGVGTALGEVADMALEIIDAVDKPQLSARQLAELRAQHEMSRRQLMEKLAEGIDQKRSARGAGAPVATLQTLEA